jgi:hypothetical protein
MSEPAADLSRDEAASQSRGCADCGGSGQVRVYDPQYDGRRSVERQVMMYGEYRRMRFPTYVLGHCVCPMGRWMRSRFARDPEMLARIPDLMDVLSGRSWWVARNPISDNEALAVPRRRLDLAAVVARVRDGQVVT